MRSNTPTVRVTNQRSLQIIAATVAAMFMIVGGDAAGTVLTNAGVSPLFVAWARFSCAALLLLPICLPKREEWRSLLDWRLILRAALIVMGISCILTALRTEPMANVFGGFFVGPIVSYFLSALVLGERITVPRTLLLALSFFGVLLVVKPGFGMTTGMALAVLAGCFHGGYLVATRWLAGSFRSTFLLYAQLLIGTVLLAPVAVLHIPTNIDGVAWMFVLSALGSAMGNLIIVMVNRTTPASVVAPLIYSQLIAAMALGWFVFGQWPDLPSFLGLLIIMVAGVSSVWIAGRGR